MRHAKPVRLGDRTLPFSRLVGTVSNSADVVRLKTAPTGGESVYLFLEFTIILRAGQVREDPSVPIDQA